MFYSENLSEKLTRMAGETPLNRIAIHEYWREDYGPLLISLNSFSYTIVPEESGQFLVVIPNDLSEEFVEIINLEELNIQTVDDFFERCDYYDYNDFSIKYSTFKYRFGN